MDPTSRPKRLLEIINEKGPECINKIKDWLDGDKQLPQLREVTDVGIGEIFKEFKTACEAAVVPEKRHFLTKSQHKLKCTTVRIHPQSKLFGCYSGPGAYVQ